MIHRLPQPFRHRLRASALGAVSVAAIGSCKGTEPFTPTPTVVAVSPASVDFHALGLVRQVTAAVLDQQGDTIPGAKVTWTSLDASVATVDTTGKITAVASGSAQVKAASSTNAGVATLVAVTVSQVAAVLSKVSHDSSATVGTPVGVSVRVTDSAGASVTGAIVDFTVTQGGGTVTAAADTTPGTGLAITSWILGTTPGPNTLSVSLSGSQVPPVTFSAVGISGSVKSMVVQAGDGQTAHVGTPVSIPPAVRLLDSLDNAVPGVIVTFTIASGGGVVAKPVDTTGADGIAAPTAWTLGSAGTNSLEASVSLGGVSGNPTTFTATATPAGAPTQVVVDTGDGQTGLAGYALNVAPAVRVLDAANGPVSGVQVDFGVTSGGGSVSGATATTDLFGIAAVGSWTVQLGANSLNATVGGLTPATFTANGASPQFNIDIQVLGTLTPVEQAAFDSAKVRWERLIYGDIPNVTISTPFPAGTCGPGTPAISGSIDDIRIYALIDSIDGPGKVLGEAGWCLIRNSDNLPVVGVMHFDSADVGDLINAGQFDEVILHEMGHVLGFGTIWTDLGVLVDPRSSGGTDPHFVGVQAIAQFDANGGATYALGGKVPVENCLNPPPRTPCGAGQYDGHWRETTFGNELMTAYIDNGANPLSAITTASMGDLGYTVNYAASSAYTVANPLAVTRAQTGGLQVLLDDVLHIPGFVIDGNGRVVRVIPPR
jgi:hypothetical protein